MFKRIISQFEAHSNSVFDYARIFAGALVIAAGINLFILPNKLVYGGLTGVCVILYHKLNIPVGLAYAVLNIPLIILGWKYGGGRRKFLTRTLVGAVAVSIGVEALGPLLSAPTTDRLLVIFYGGILDGLGLALIFQGRGTTGGTDVIARILYRTKGVPFGQTMLGANLIVYVIGVTQFGFEPVMVAFVLAFVSARALDAALMGFSATRAAFIISSEHEAVKKAVFKNLRRGVTVLSGYGGYTGESRPMLYMVVPPSEVPRLKKIVTEIDPHAFLSVTPAQDLVGGFPRRRPLSD
ncbi:MAG: YitT family protein [Candidatus Sumerlaeota bacterium]